MAFYAVRGWRLDELADLSATEKVFLGCAREQYYQEVSDILTAIFSGKGRR